jgi:hypothetical protein
MNEAQQPNQGQYGEPKPSPCNDPKPPDPPKPPEQPKCPPVDECPKPKDPPDWPKRPPDPCDDKPAAASGDQSQTGGGATTGGQTQPPYGSNGTTPAEHLAALKKEYEDGQKQLQQLEPLKSKQTDLEKRIKDFETTIDSQSSSETAYKDFYKAIDLLKHDIVCFIPTARCQLELTDKQKQCICDAIKAVDVRVDKAKNDAAAQKQAVEQLEIDARRKARDLEWKKKWHDFLKTTLQQQISAQRDDLKKLKGLITPAANPCEAFFYLYELERLIQSAYGTDEACWKDTIWVATFLDCWPWENYSKAWNKALVDYNKADAADKLVKSQLEQARKLLETLDKAAADATAKRREWILKEIKTRDCCGFAKCP